MRFIFLRRSAVGCQALEWIQGMSVGLRNVGTVSAVFDSEAVERRCTQRAGHTWMVVVNVTLPSGHVFASVAFILFSPLAGGRCER